MYLRTTCRKQPGYWQINQLPQAEIQPGRPGLSNLLSLIMNIRFHVYMMQVDRNLARKRTDDFYLVAPD